MSAPCCFQCGRALTHDETAIYRKLVNRGAEQFLCADCLARHFRVEVEMIYRKIAECKERGCTLF